MAVSIIICCYNSSERISNTIKYLCNQKVLDSLNVELLFINNNSNDNTVLTIKKVLYEHNCRFDSRIINEPKQGLVFAKERGFIEAKYEILIFCDDDNWLEENYVQSAYTIMNSNSLIGALGGDGIAVSDVKFPNWFDSVKYQYAVGMQGDKEGDITKSRGFVWGAGMVVRKSVLSSIYNADFRSQLVGRSGKNLNAGEDTELCYAIILAGYKIWYSPKLIFNHFIEKHRLSEEYFYRMDRGIEDCQKVLSRYREVIHLVSSEIKSKHLKFAKSILALTKNSIFNKLTRRNRSLKPSINYILNYLKLNHLRKDQYSSIWKYYYDVNKIN